MSNTRKARRNPAPRKPRFPLESFPQQLQEAIRAVAKAERVTIGQAGMAAVLAMDRAAGDRVTLTAPDGRLLGTPGLIDIEFLVPDPADRPGVLRACRRLLAELPGSTRARIAGDSTRTVARAEAVAVLAGRYESRDAYLVTAGPDELAAAMKRLGGVPGCTCWLDNGTDTVLTFTGDVIAMLPVLMDTLPSQVPLCGVLAIPKTISASDISAALGQDIPADGSQDLILLAPPDTGEITWPLCLVQAIARSDPRAAADLVRADRDRKLEGASAAVRALVDQADAAMAHGGGFLAAMAEFAGSELVHEAPSPVVREIAGRLPALAKAGQVDVCPHVSPSAPMPVVWFAWNPGLVGCAPCAAPAAGSVAGTDEDQRCDYCREHSGLIHNSAAMLPAVVAELPGGTVASGPVAVMFGLCPACHAEAFPDGGRAA